MRIEQRSGLITLEAESVGLPPYRKGIEFPNPDFAALARACGGHGFTAREPNELNAMIDKCRMQAVPGHVSAKCGAGINCRAIESCGKTKEKQVTDQPFSGSVI